MRKKRDIRINKNKRVDCKRKYSKKETYQYNSTGM